MVVEAEELRQAVQVGVLHDQVPVAVVLHLVVVVDRQLHTPVLPVVRLHVPVHADRAHVLGAPDDRGVRVVVAAGQCRRLVVPAERNKETSKERFRKRAPQS